MAYYYPGSSRDLQSRRAIISQDIGQIDGILPSLVNQGVAPVGDTTLSTRLSPAGRPPTRERTWEWSLPPILFGVEAQPPGDQWTLRPPHYLARPKARDYTYTASQFAGLVIAPPVNPDQQSIELPPRAAARQRDYSFVETLFAGLIGQDATNAGVQSVELPPRPAARARDYTWTQSQSLPAFQELPSGASTDATENPPRAALRSRDYSFTESLFAALIGADALNAGVQLTGNAPRGYQRAVSLSEPGVNLLVELTAALPIAPVGQSTAPTELAPRAVARARDYTWAQQTQAQLIGQDALAPGEQLFNLPAPARARAISLSDPGANVTLSLSGTSPIGQQATDLPPRSQPRARDYTHFNRLPNLIGQDQLPTGDSTYATDNPPRAAQRARDYTWLQSLPAHIYEAPVGKSTQASESPPRGPLRARDYTYLDLTKRHLIGQDRLYGAPGEVPAYDWPLPTPARRRAREYTYLQRLDLSSVAAATRAGTHVLTDSVLFVHTLTDRVLYEHELTDEAKAVHTLGD